MRARKKNLLIIIICFALILSSVLTLELFNIGKIIWGLKVAGMKIGGMDRSLAFKILNETEKNFLEQKIDLRLQDRTWTVKIKELGVVFYPQKTIEKAYQLGRERNLLVGIKNQIAACLGLFDLKPDFEINQEVLNETIKEKMFAIEKPAQNAALIYNRSKGDFDVIQPEEGIVINRVALIGDLEEQLSTLKPAAIELFLIKDKPIIFQDRVEEVKKKMLDILTVAPFILKFEGEEFKIQKDELLEMIEFIPIESPDATKSEKTLAISVSHKKLNDFLAVLAPAVNRAPVNAQLTVKNGRAEIFQLAKEGLRLNIEKNTELISKMILIPEKEIELIVEKEQPLITQETIENLGIIHFLGKGTSNFSGSSAARVNNIRIGAFKFHGLIIGPDEEFSFIKILGDVGPEQGYLPGLVIKPRKTVLEYGGGLCQVSTTMFRAAVNAGLKITERYPHSFPVAFYNPQGFDATIYPPNVDLKFVNDTPANILIQTKIEGNNLTFEIYGTKDREVKVTTPEEYDKKQDGSMKAKFTQEIWQNGELTRKKTFYSVYQSPNLFPERRNPLQ